MDYFQRNSWPTSLILDWNYLLCMHEGLLLHTEWSKSAWQDLNNFHKKTLLLTDFKEFINIHQWFWTESITIWRSFTAYRILHDLMIQKGVAGLRMISIKNIVVDYFQRICWPTWLILDWKYLCMKGFYCILDFSCFNYPKGRGRT